MDRIQVAVPIILNKQNKVLITQRLGLESEPEKAETIWAFPGVKYSPDSTESEIKQALKAAVKHKTGFQIEVGEQISERDHSEMNEHIKYYECSLATLVVKPILSIQETQKVQWVEPQNLKEYFTTSLDKGVAKFLNVEPFSAQEAKEAQKAADSNSKKEKK